MYLNLHTAPDSSLIEVEPCFPSSFVKKGQ